MFRRWRLKKVHSKFLESCRNLKEKRSYWSQAGGLTRWFLQILTPVPLMGVDEDGSRILVALEWLEANCAVTPLTEEVIRGYHRMVWNGDRPGVYRKSAVFVVGSALPRATPDKVSPLMKAFDAKLKGEQERLSDTSDAKVILHLAMEVYQRLGLIHPFEDANGRVSRLAMNHVLRRFGQGYVTLPRMDETPELLPALEQAHAGKLDALCALARQHCHRV